MSFGKISRVGIRLNITIVIALFLTSSNSATSGLTIYPVDQNSDIDSIENQGFYDSTISSAQSLDGEYQSIEEINSPQNQIYEDYIDQITDVDSSNNIGSLSNFSNLMDTDNQIAEFSEIVDPNSIYFVNSTTLTDTGVESTIMELGLPGSTIDGDLMVAILASSITNGDGSTIDTYPVGWTYENDFIYDLNPSGQHIYVYWKLASGESGTYEWNWTDPSGWVGTILSFRGVNFTNPIETFGNTLNGNDVNPISPSITTASNKSQVLSLIVQDSNTLVTGNQQPPQGTLMLTQGSTTTGGNGLGLAISAFNQTQYGNSSDQSWIGFLGSAEEWIGWQIALRPNSEPVRFVGDFEFQFTNVVNYLSSEMLSIKLDDVDNVETLRVNYWDGLQWNSIGELSTIGWNNFSVPLTSDTFTIQLIGDQLLADDTKDEWEIDAILLVISGDGLQENSISDYTTNLDNFANLGSVSNFLDLEISDSNYASLEEDTWKGPIEFQRASGSIGITHSIDIGTPGNHRLVAVFVGNESTGISTPSVYIDGKLADQIILADNSNGLGNQISLWILTESGLGSSSGTVNIDLIDGDPSYAIHSLVFYNVKDTINVYDVQVDESSVAQSEILPSLIDIPENGLLLFSASNGQSGNYIDDGWDTNPTETTDDNILPEIEMVEAIDTAYPTSAVMAEAYWISNTSSQTDRQFRATGSVVNNRGSGILVSFEPASYRFDQEIQWNNLLHDQQVEELSILTGNFTGEPLDIDYWNGSEWNYLSSLLPNSWNNISIEFILTSSIFTIRLRDNITSNDNTKDTWQIDTLLITYFSASTHYILEWEQQSTDINTDYEEFEFSLFGFSSNGTESFGVEFWNYSGGFWTNPLLEIGSTENWYNHSIVDVDLVSTNITWRYVSLNDELFDTQQTTLFIDYVAIEAYDEDPVVVVPQDDITISEGSLGNELVWQFYDKNPGTYRIVRGGEQLTGDINWYNYQDIVFSVDGYTKGVYNFVIQVKDSHNNQQTDSVKVTVIDDMVPIVLNNTNAITYVEGTFGHKLSWNIFDNHPGDFEIRRNGSYYGVSGQWGENPLEINIDGLTKGVYNFSIIASDDSDNIAENYILVTVVDGTPPQANCTLAISVSEESSNNMFEIAASDNYPGLYRVFRNGSLLEDFQSWNNSQNITIQIDGLTKGVYNYTVSVFDDSGNVNIKSIIVSVLDLTPPHVNSNSGNIVYGQGVNGNVIWWNVNDTYPESYILYKNGTEIVSGDWAVEVLTFDVDGLLSGEYNYTLQLFDDSGNSFTDMLIVSVIEERELPNILTDPDDLVFNEGSTGNILQWTVFDDYPSIYRIYLNGSLVWADSWKNYQPIVYNLDELELGYYNLTIEFQDISTNMAHHYVSIRVIDNISPELSGYPVEMEIIVETSDNNAEIEVFDQHPNKFEIYKNGEYIREGLWSNNVAIQVNLDGLAIGNYTFMIKIFDSSYNSISIEIQVQVRYIETEVENLSLVTELHEGYVDEITGMWVDENGDPIEFGFSEVKLVSNVNSDEVFLQYSSIVLQGYFELAIDYTGISAGIYYLVLELHQTSYRNQILEFQIEVLPHQISIDFDLPNQLIQGENYTILITVSYNDAMSEITLDEFGGKTGAASGITVEVSLYLEFRNGTTFNIIEKILTNDNGIAYLTITSDITSHVKKIESIQATVPSQNEIQEEIASVPLHELPIITSSSDVVTSRVVDVPGIGSISVAFFWTVLTIILSILGGILAYKYNLFKREKSEFIFNELRKANNEIEGLKSVKLVIVINESGLPIYSRQVKSIGLDPLLLSGISSAISALLQEVGDQKFYGIQVIENEGLSITSHKSENVNFIVISSQGLPDVMLEQMKPVNQIVENEFGHVLGRNLTSRVNPIRMEEIFADCGFKLDLTGLLEVNQNRLIISRLDDTIDKKIKSGLELLENVIEITNNRVTLDGLFELYQNQGYSTNLVSKVILTAYNHKILVPLVGQPREFM